MFWERGAFRQLWQSLRCGVAWSGSKRVAYIGFWCDPERVLSSCFARLSRTLEPIEELKNHLTRTSGDPQNLLRSVLVFGNQAGVGEGREHVLGVVAFDAVEVEEGRVKLGTDFSPLRFLPDMDAVAARALEVAGSGEGDHVLGRAGEFQDALADPVFERFLLRPRALVGVGVGRQRGELFDDEEVESDTADLLPRDVVEDDD